MNHDHTAPPPHEEARLTNDSTEHHHHHSWSPPPNRHNPPPPAATTPAVRPATSTTTPWTRGWTAQLFGSLGDTTTTTTTPLVKTRDTAAARVVAAAAPPDMDPSPPPQPSAPSSLLSWNRSALKEDPYKRARFADHLEDASHNHHTNHQVNSSRPVDRHPTSSSSAQASWKKIPPIHFPVTTDRNEGATSWFAPPARNHLLSNTTTWNNNNDTGAARVVGNQPQPQAGYAATTGTREASTALAVATTTRTGGSLAWLPPAASQPRHSYHPASARWKRLLRRYDHHLPTASTTTTTTTRLSTASDDPAAMRDWSAAVQRTRQALLTQANSSSSAVADALRPHPLAETYTTKFRPGRILTVQGRELWTCGGGSSSIGGNISGTKRGREQVEDDDDDDAEQEENQHRPRMMKRTTVQGVPGEPEDQGPSKRTKRVTFHPPTPEEQDADGTPARGSTRPRTPYPSSPAVSSRSTPSSSSSMTLMEEQRPIRLPCSALGPYNLDESAEPPASLPPRPPPAEPLEASKGAATFAITWTRRPKRGARGRPPTPLVLPVVPSTISTRPPEEEGPVESGPMSTPSNPKKRQASEGKSEETNSIPPWDCPTCHEVNTHPSTCQKCGYVLSMSDFWAMQMRNKWKCSNCMSTNDNAVSVCQSCEAPRSAETAAASTAPAPAATVSQPSTPFVFGAAPPTPAVGASSTAPPAEVKPLFTFGVAPASTGFTFGATAPTTAASESTVSGPASTTLSTAASLGMPPIATTSTASAPTAGFTFGATIAAPAPPVEPKTGGFSFGTSSSASSVPTTLPESAPTTETSEIQKFSFGSQKSPATLLGTEPTSALAPTLSTTPSLFSFAPSASMASNNNNNNRDDGEGSHRKKKRNDPDKEVEPTAPAFSAAPQPGSSGLFSAAPFATSYQGGPADAFPSSAGVAPLFGASEKKSEAPSSSSGNSTPKPSFSFGQHAHPPLTPAAPSFSSNMAKERKPEEFSQPTPSLTAPPPFSFGSSSAAKGGTSFVTGFSNGGVGPQADFGSKTPGQFASPAPAPSNSLESNSTGPVTPNPFASVHKSNDSTTAAAPSLFAPSSTPGPTSSGPTLFGMPTTSTAGYVGATPSMPTTFGTSGPAPANPFGNIQTSVGSSTDGNRFGGSNGFSFGQSSNTTPMQFGTAAPPASGGGTSMGVPLFGAATSTTGGSSASGGFGSSAGLFSSAPAPPASSGGFGNTAANFGPPPPAAFQNSATPTPNFPAFGAPAMTGPFGMPQTPGNTGFGQPMAPTGVGGFAQQPGFAMSGMPPAGEGGFSMGATDGGSRRAGRRIIRAKRPTSGRPA